MAFETREDLIRVLKETVDKLEEFDDDVSDVVVVSGLVDDLEDDIFQLKNEGEE